MSADQNDMSELQERLKRQNGYSYRLEGDKFGLDVAIDGDYEVDESEMSLVVPFADGNRRDGVGDLLEISGIDVSRHRLNPISLFDHGKSVTLPLGLFCDPKSQEYTVMLDPIAKTAKGKLFVYQGSGIPNGSKDQEYPHAVFCQQIFDLWVKKFIRAGSIGYQVKDARQLQPDYERGTQAGLHLLKILMLEGSVVVMPANQDTVRKSYDIAREILAMPQVCGKSLSPLLVKSLQPYVQDYNKVVTGFVPKAGCVNCNQPFNGITHNVLGKELCSPCYMRTIESQIKSIAPPQVGEIQPDKVETVKVPRGQDHTQTNIPPADWKPGQGATKDLCPNNSRITLSDDYGCPAAYDSQRKGMAACKSCGKSLRLVPFLVKDMPIEEIEQYEKALVGSLEKGWNIIYQSKAAVVDDIGEIDDGKIKVLLTDGRKFIADPEDYVKKVSGNPVDDPKYDMAVEDGLSPEPEPIIKNIDDNIELEARDDYEEDDTDMNALPGKTLKSVRAKYKFLRQQRSKGFKSFGDLHDAIRALEDPSSVRVYHNEPMNKIFVNVMDWGQGDGAKKIIKAASSIVGSENVEEADEGLSPKGNDWREIKCDGKGDNPSKYSKGLIGSTGEKFRDPDEMLAGGMPHFVTDSDDRYKLEENAPNELRKWREAVAKHNQLPSTSAKLKHRKELERVFDDLKRAYDKMKRGGKSIKGLRKKYSKGYPGERRILVENIVVGDKLSTLGSQQVVRKIRRNTDDPHQMEIELENGELIYRRCGDPVYVTMRGKSINGWKAYYDISRGAWEAEQAAFNAMSEKEKEKIRAEKKKEQDKWQKEQNERKEKERKEKEKKQKEIEAATKKKMADQIKKDKEVVSKMKSEAESFFSRMKNKYSVLVNYEVKTRTDYEDYDEDGNAYKTHGLDIKLEFSDWINNKKTMKLFFKNTEYGVSGIDSFKDLLNTIEDDFRQSKNSKSLGWKSYGSDDRSAIYNATGKDKGPVTTWMSGDHHGFTVIDSNGHIVYKSPAKYNTPAEAKREGNKYVESHNVKSLGAIRHKYRTTKGLVRRLRKSASGSSMIMVRSKDMDALEQEALEKGLTINRVGSHTKGIEKVRLSGHDGSIDAVAKRFGRVLRKSLNGWKSHKS